jgi:hypothetical protein
VLAGGENMKNRSVPGKIARIGLLVALAASTAHAGKGFLEVEAEATPDNVPRGNAAQTDCVFRNVSHFDTVEAFMTVDVRFSDGTKVTLADSELLGVMAPGDGFLFRGAVVVDENAALGTAVLVCSAESTIVGGPRPEGQSGVDSDSATFGVFEIVTPGTD